MLLKRIMPCLLFNGKALVKTKKFRDPDYIGDPINAIKIYNEKEVDELILLDITASKEKRRPSFEKVGEFASECFMPFTYGGGVSELDDFKKLFSLGVEKVALNTILFSAPQIVKEAVRIFGSQAIVAVVDVKSSSGVQKVYSHLGHAVKSDLPTYLRYLEDELGIGEIVLQDVDREGTWSGYNHELIKRVSQQVNIPVIALGGAADQEDIKRVLYDSGADAAALGSMAVYQKKDMGVLIRFPKRQNIVIEE